jgi:hypothetical protein
MTSDPTEIPDEGMGVSSEREGPTGPGQHGDSGLLDTSPPDPEAAEDTPPEQSAGGPETNPDGLDPKAGYPSKDPRSG